MILTRFGYIDDEASEFEPSQIVNDLMTPQEYWYGGGTPDIKPQTEIEFHTPIGIIKGHLTVGQAQTLRDRLGFFSAPGFMYATGLTILAFKYQLLDKEGATIMDPDVLGEVDLAGQRIILHEELNLKEVIRQALQDIDQNLKDLAVFPLLRTEPKQDSNPEKR